MKVIESVEDFRDYVLIERCTGRGNGSIGCNTRLLISASDLYYTYDPFVSGIKNVHVHKTTFCCPVCGVETDVSDKIPFEVSVYMTSVNAPKKIKKRLLNYKQD